MRLLVEDGDPYLTSSLEREENTISVTFPVHGAYTLNTSGQRSKVHAVKLLLPSAHIFIIFRFRKLEGSRNFDKMQEIWGLVRKMIIESRGLLATS